MKAAKLIIAAAVISAMVVPGAASASEFGVGVSMPSWSSSWAPFVAIPIKTDAGWVIEPMVQFLNFSVDEGSSSGISAGTAQDYSFDITGTVITIGANAEKQSQMDAISPVFGACALFQMVSPDADNQDSYSNFGFGGYLGGNAPLTDGVDIYGHVGAKVGINGEQKGTSGNTEVVFQRSSTEITTFASVGLRFWVFGK